jgi:hypothetical protein
VDNFIVIGSPVGLFCALRGVNANDGRPLGSPAAGTLYPNSAPGGLPVCRRMYNVFHPYDPVACRIEPLVYKEAKKAAVVPYHRGGLKFRAGFAQTGESVSRTVTWAFTLGLRRSDGGSAIEVCPLLRAQARLICVRFRMSCVQRTYKTICLV